MRKLVLRMLVVNALLQFLVFRGRAARVEDEGAAAALWMRYPAAVIGGALAWSLTLSIIARATRSFRPRR